MMSAPLDAAPVKRCAICGKPADPRFQPFCSKRCSDVDLHRWLSGTYVIPTSEISDDEEQRVLEADKQAD
ncbi:MAG: uncharacterized protein QOF19_1523 [Alphaproteobacteria bacterium]|jgi:endogenous inhibitor of DNA gyrase (YacG/DUF329 family)|nr:uncharacterized protein [Alphaproteobacteria bacterium]